MHYFRLGIIGVLVTCTMGYRGLSQNIQYNRNSPQQQYAAGRLAEAFRNLPAKNDYTIRLVADSVSVAFESFSVSKQRAIITIRGGSDRALIYGCLSLAEDLRNGVAPGNYHGRTENASLPFRAIKFDLPWDSYRHSYALSLHDKTCRDTAYWKSFLDMMAENRFNTLTLWNLHPYTFLIKPKNFPEASPWNEKEMMAWQQIFHAILRMANERGIDTYLVPFNIFVTPEFARAHQVAMDNLSHNYFVKGDTSAIIKQYTRECVTQLLDEYPELTGFGLTLGEGMAGMTPQQREDWMNETIIEGMRQAHRKLKLIHRIPFSSTTGSLGITSIETEKLTRQAMETEASAGFLQSPVWADLKFNWSHAHSTTKLIKVHGGKLYDTYFRPNPETYKIVWTARNEDFFCLRWGVPSFIREHISNNIAPWSGGYIIGSETYIPARDYFTKDSLNQPWHYAFERQWLFYKIWGRLLYKPDTPDDLFLAEMKHRYGPAAKKLLAASSLAGATALRIASDFDCGWDFTLYTEGMMALDTATKNLRYIDVEWLARQPTLDSDYVSVENYLKRKSAGDSFSKREITPPQLANSLVKDCSEALELVKRIDTRNNKALLYEVADIRIWARLGLHFAAKIEAALALRSYRSSGREEDKRRAVASLQKALENWDDIISIADPLYNEMPLVHLSQQGGKETPENFYLTFHWKKLRPDLLKDLEMAKQAVVKLP